MRRYQTDRFGMISSFDIAEALRRAEARRLEEEIRRREREARAAARLGRLARLRALLGSPRRSTA
jgi:hypothetical protein